MEWPSEESATTTRASEWTELIQKTLRESKSAAVTSHAHVVYDKPITCECVMDTLRELRHSTAFRETLVWAEDMFLFFAAAPRF